MVNVVNVVNVPGEAKARSIRRETVARVMFGPVFRIKREFHWERSWRVF